MALSTYFKNRSSSLLRQYAIGGIRVFSNQERLFSLITRNRPMIHSNQILPLISTSKGTHLPLKNTISILQQRQPYSSDKSDDEISKSTEDKKATSIPKPENQQKYDESYLIAFTCKKCGNRASHYISKQSYHSGTVLIQCPGCKVRHLISDHLKIFSDSRITIEDILKSKGESIEKQSGDLILDELPDNLKMILGGGFKVGNGHTHTHANGQTCNHSHSHSHSHTHSHSHNESDGNDKHSKSD